MVLSYDFMTENVKIKNGHLFGDHRYETHPHKAERSEQSKYRDVGTIKSSNSGVFF